MGTGDSSLLSALAQRRLGGQEGQWASHALCPGGTRFGEPGPGTPCHNQATAGQGLMQPGRGQTQVWLVHSVPRMNQVHLSASRRVHWLRPSEATVVSLSKPQKCLQQEHIARDSAHQCGSRQPPWNVCVAHYRGLPNCMMTLSSEAVGCYRSVAVNVSKTVTLHPLGVTANERA